jgi:hypothetical protein
MMATANYHGWVDAVVECIAFRRSWQFAREHERDIRTFLGRNYGRIARQGDRPIADEAAEAYLDPDRLLMEDRP